MHRTWHTAGAHNRKYFRISRSYLLHVSYANKRVVATFFYFYYYYYVYFVSFFVCFQMAQHFRPIATAVADASYCCLVLGCVASEQCSSPACALHVCVFVVAILNRSHFAIILRICTFRTKNTSD